MIHILNRKRVISAGGGGGSLWPDISGTVFNQSLSVATDALNCDGVFWKVDGTKCYISSAGVVYQYSAGTAWRVSTLTYDTVSFNTGAGFSGSGIKFKPDGTKLYMAMYQQERVYQATLSTAWDLSTASNDHSTVIEVEATADSIRDIDLSSDGSKLFCLWNNDLTIREYPLSTAWDISTVGSRTTSKTPLVDSGVDRGRGIYFDPNNGQRLIYCARKNLSDGMRLYQYDLSTGYDLTTMDTTASASINLGSSSPSADSSPNSLYVKSDGSKVYIVGETNDRIYEFDLT